MQTSRKGFPPCTLQAVSFQSRAPGQHPVSVAALTSRTAACERKDRGRSRSVWMVQRGAGGCREGAERSSSDRATRLLLRILHRLCLPQPVLARRASATVCPAAGWPEPGSCPAEPGTERPGLTDRGRWAKTLRVEGCRRSSG